MNLAVIMGGTHGEGFDKAEVLKWYQKTLLKCCVLLTLIPASDTLKVFLFQGGKHECHGSSFKAA